jgi:hypothetical protein
MKKKLVCLVMVLALVSGCAFLKTVKDFICNPTAEQMETAALMLVALDAIQAAGGSVYPPIALIKASAVLTTIQGGGCFLVAELEEIFKILDAAEMAKLKAKGLVIVRIETYPALRKLLKK